MFIIHSVSLPAELGRDREGTREIERERDRERAEDRDRERKRECVCEREKTSVDK